MTIKTRTAKTIKLRQKLKPTDMFNYEIHLNEQTQVQPNNPTWLVLPSPIIGGGGGGGCLGPAC